MRAASAGDPGPNMSVAELVTADVPEGERVGFVRMWVRELRDALRRGQPDQGAGDPT